MWTLVFELVSFIGLRDSKKWCTAESRRILTFSSSFCHGFLFALLSLDIF